MYSAHLLCYPSCVQHTAVFFRSFATCGSSFVCSDERLVRLHCLCTTKSSATLCNTPGQSLTAFSWFQLHSSTNPRSSPDNVKLRLYLLVWQPIRSAEATRQKLVAPASEMGMPHMHECRWTFERIPRATRNAASPRNNSSIGQRRGRQWIVSVLRLTWLTHVLGTGVFQWCLGLSSSARCSIYYEHHMTHPACWQSSKVQLRCSLRFNVLLRAISS